MEEKEFEYHGVIEIIEIIEDKDIVEFSELIKYVCNEINYKSRYHLEVISDNSYMIVKYIESKKRIMERND